MQDGFEMDTRFELSLLTREKQKILSGVADRLWLTSLPPPSASHEVIRTSTWIGHCSEIGSSSLIIIGIVIHYDAFHSFLLKVVAHIYTITMSQLKGRIKP